MGSFVRGFLGGRPRIIPYCDGSDMLVHSSGPLLEGFSRLRNVKERFMVLDLFSRLARDCGWWNWWGSLLDDCKAFPFRS